MDREELNRRFEELGSRVGTVESQSHAVAAVMPAVESVVADSGGPDEEHRLYAPPDENVMGGGDVTLHGTDGSELAGDDFTFASAADSNVAVKLEETTGTDAKRKIEIGVYYV